MTALGKILVIVNLLFSLFTGGFIVTVYATKTNWKAAFDEASRRLTVARANADTYEARLVDAERREGEAQKVLTEEKQAHLKDREEYDTKVKANLDMVAKANMDREKADANLRVATAQATRMQTEVKSLQDIVVTRDKRVLALEASNKELREQKVAFEIASKSEQDRNASLVNQLELMSKEIEKNKAGGLTGTSVRSTPDNPPPDDVEGLVKATDTQSGYVTITLGSDAGINVGNTMEVFRLKPEPKYLGTIRIVAVNPHEAVGRPVTPTRKGLIQNGDRVASKIQAMR